MTGAWKYGLYTPDYSLALNLAGGVNISRAEAVEVVRTGPVLGVDTLVRAEHGQGAAGPVESVGAVPQVCRACLHHLKAVTFCSLGQKIQLFCHKVFTSRKFHALFCKSFRRFFTFLVQQPDHTRLGRAAKMRTVVTVISLLTTRMTTLTKLRWRTERMTL